MATQVRCKATCDHNPLEGPILWFFEGYAGAIGPAELYGCIYEFLQDRFGMQCKCPYTFIVVWMEACRMSSCWTFIGAPVSSSQDRYV